MKRLVTFGTAIAAAFLCACGYTASLRASETQPRTVGIELFGNTSYERDLERLFYDEMARAVRDSCDAELVDPSRADWVIRGEIQSYRRRSGIRSPDNVLLETGVYIQVQAALFERGAAAPKAPPSVAGTWVGFVIEGPEAERDARDRALRNIADELVLELFIPVN